MLSLFGWRVFHCVRIFCAKPFCAGNDPVSIYFRTFNENEPANGKASLRSQDGLFESGHSRPANDPFFSVGSLSLPLMAGLRQPLQNFWRYAHPAQSSCGLFCKWSFTFLPPKAPLPGDSSHLYICNTWFPDCKWELKAAQECQPSLSLQESMGLSDAERREGLPECTFWRCAAIDAQVTLPLKYSLFNSCSPSPPYHSCLSLLMTPERSRQRQEAISMGSGTCSRSPFRRPAIPLPFLFLPLTLKYYHHH